MVQYNQNRSPFIICIFTGLESSFTGFFHFVPMMDHNLHFFFTEVVVITYGTTVFQVCWTVPL